MNVSFRWLFFFIFLLGVFCQSLFPFSTAQAAPLAEIKNVRIHADKDKVRIVVDADLAEDVLQEAFWQVWQRASSFDPAKGSAKAWLAVLARRRAIDCVRSRESRRLREASSAKFDVECDSVAEAVFSHERRGEVARAVADLDQPVRSCIDAVFFRSMTHVQAAQALNMPLGTLKTHVRNGIAQLREVVEDR